MTLDSDDKPSLNLGVIGNGAYNALIDTRGRMVWCCLPRFDGDPVFNSLLDPSENGACWQFELEDFARGEQHYEPNTAVLITRLFDHRNQGVEITDFAPRFASRGRMFRPLTMVRRVKVLGGSPRMRVLMRPRFEWGRTRPMVTQGSSHLRYVGPGTTLRMNTDAPISYILSETFFLVDRPLNFILGPDETLQTGIEDTARLFEQETVAYWRQWSRSLALPLEWQDAVIRAAITLKLSLYEDTGAIIAAMTTSIPEAPHSGRNWDYRYCWLRDAFFVVRALNSISEVATMEEYLRWLMNIVVRSGGGHIQPLYGIGSEEKLPEHIVEHLPGYRGMGPVRVGNQAQEHFQHDVYGNIILASAQAFHDHRLFRRAGRAEFQYLEAVGEQAFRIYDSPDAGMWELRTRARVHTSSALMSWTACDRLAKVAAALALPERIRYWRDRADTIRARILKEAWSEERQAFAESFGGRDLDASVLLMAEVNMIDPHDARFVATVEALERSLCDGPYMRRYEAADDFGKPETAFNICTFWRIDALARIGRKGKAREIFEVMLKSRNHLGLLSEDTHPLTGEMWGNFPQTYSMVGTINAAVRLSAPWDSVVSEGSPVTRLVVVSNRIADPRKTAAGGLAVAMGEVLNSTGGLWFGWSGKVGENGTPGEGAVHSQQAGPVKLVTVDLSRADHDSFYLGYSNGVLWPVFHYRLDLADFDAGYIGGYRRVNQLFARKLMPLLKPGDLVWVHDYHLIPLAAELRALGSTHRIGFFLHIPLPPPLILAAIPGHDWLIRALFAYDLVGFQSEADLGHFARYVEAEAHAQPLDDNRWRAFGRTLEAGAYPIGIDVEEFTTLTHAPEARDMYERMRTEYSRRKLLVGVDRLDYSKGLPQRLRAFRYLLDKYPESRNVATLIQIASPSREDVGAYSDILKEMEALCGSINGNFGELDWMPVRYLHRTVARARLPGLYRASRVALVTPLRDGMNLVAKEFVVAQNPEDPGVLVLSRFAGAAEQLREALLVNPYDTEGTAAAIQLALAMPLEERRERHETLMKTIRRYDVHWWCDTFLKVLEQTKAEEKGTPWLRL